MRRFAYLRDPLFLMSVVAYGINRFALKPHVESGFVHNHVNDVLCIAIWTPVLAWLRHVLRVRGHHAPPTANETVLPLVMWSWMFEVWLPTTTFSSTPFVADPMDVLNYAAGALGAMLWWRWWYRGDDKQQAASLNDAEGDHDHGATESPMPLAR